MPHYVPHFEFSEPALDQALTFVSNSVGERMWTRNRPSEHMDPAEVVEYVKSLGVDVTNWGD